MCILRKTVHQFGFIQNQILYFVNRVFRYNRVKINQLDAQLILSIFRQLLHVSGVFRRYSTSVSTQRLVLIILDTAGTCRA